MVRPVTERKTFFGVVFSSGVSQLPVPLGAGLRDHTRRGFSQTGSLRNKYARAIDLYHKREVGFKSLKISHVLRFGKSRLIFIHHTPDLKVRAIELLFEFESEFPRDGILIERILSNSFISQGVSQLPVPLGAGLRDHTSRGFSQTGSHRR
jgi:hypothetical protein